MNGNTGTSGRWWHASLRRLAAQAAAAVAVVLLAAACGGGGSSSGNHSTRYQQELAFSQCMRAHGVSNFPDPGSNGVFSVQVPHGAGQNHRLGGPQMNRANNACRHLLPNGGEPTAAQRQQLLNQGLRFAECMRAHGVTNFPDPPTGGSSGPVKLGSRGLDIRSPQFQSANHACTKLLGIPNGGIRIAG